MNQLKAMADTLGTIISRDLTNLDETGPCSLDHLKEMHASMQGHFSEAKMGRWLGWAQGMLCGRGILTLDECKEINKRWAD